jgi:hypothetical protein
LKTYNTHNFILEISPPSGITEEDAADALYAAGCDDATLSVSNGIWELEFDRQAITMLDAVLSAKKDIAASGVKTRVLHVRFSDTSTSILYEVGSILRTHFLSQASQLVFKWPTRKVPPAVRKLERIFAERPCPFGPYTDEVARLLSEVVGHEISTISFRSPKAAPAGAFMVALEDGERVKRGDVVVAVGGVRGFGNNIFAAGLGMLPDGQVGGSLTTKTARPAKASEIKGFIKKASPRALVVLAEILEERKIK